MMKKIATFVILLFTIYPFQSSAQQVGDSTTTYSDEELAALRSDPNTLAIEDFSSNSQGWPEETHNSDNLRGFAGLRDGAYIYDMEMPANQTYAYYVYNPSENYVVNEPFEFSVDMSNFQINHENWSLWFGFNAKEDIDSRGAVANIGALYAIAGDRTWSFSGYYEGGRVDPLSGPLPSNIDFTDGRAYRVTVRVGESSGRINATLLINGEIIATQTAPDNSFIQRVNNAYDDIDGAVFLALSILPNQSVTTTHVTLQFDNLILYRYSPGAVASGTGMGPLVQQFQSDIPRLSFQYPEDWVVAGKRLFTDRRTDDTGDIYNITLYNNPNGFAGQPNEMGFTLYEPIYIMEQTLLTDISTPPLAEVLENFVISLEGASVWDATSGVEELDLAVGRQAVRTSISQDDRDRMWLAFRSSDSSITIMEVFTAPGQLVELGAKALEIAATVDYPLPSHQLEDHEELLRKYLNMANAGLAGQALSLMCPADRVGFSLFNTIIDEMGGIGGMLGFATLRDADAVGFSVNADNRYFETVQIENNIVYVRVRGTLRVIYIGGAQQVVRHKDFFSGDGATGNAQSAFGLDVFRLTRNDQGYWEVCPGMFR